MVNKDYKIINTAAPIEICLRFAIFSIETLRFSMLKQLLSSEALFVQPKLHQSQSQYL